MNSKPMTALQTKIYMGTKQAGTYDPETALMFVEEMMTVAEYKQAEAFLNWVIENKRTFGYNLPQVWNEFVLEAKLKVNE